MATVGTDVTIKRLLLKSNNLCIASNLHMCDLPVAMKTLRTRGQQCQSISPVGTPDKLQGERVCLRSVTGGGVTPPSSSPLIQRPEPWEGPRERQTNKKRSQRREVGATWDGLLDWQTLPRALPTPSTATRERHRSLRSVNSLGLLLGSLSFFIPFKKPCLGFWWHSFGY